MQYLDNPMQIIPLSPLHGYSLGFKFTFGCNELDNKNWAVDFGGLKPKAWLEEQFDHKVVIDSQKISYGRLL